ncbi:MAG: nucleoside triphosphate pyrophosphohydrolase [Gammaproteobacteria bacterium]|nr:nucleoside triphosphate pyrophosphohydrolase [Gammaproteobacteria bacterium]
MRRLRDPERGCPWDRAQDFASIAPYTIEEAYEVADAIDRADPARLCDELGDLLFQVVFHARMAEERGWFDFAAVARGIVDKLVRRHPHVFADDAGTDDHALAHAWDMHKAVERQAAGLNGTLAGVARALPALARAAKLGRRAGRVGFDWPDLAGVRAKVQEERAEADAAAAVADAAGTAAEIGDLLFAVANWARHLQVDPEEALRQSGARFERRFAAMEAQAAARGQALETLDAAAWDALWNAAKRAERGGGGAVQ